MEKLGFQFIKNIDVDGLLDDVKEEHWNAITARQDCEGSPHSDTRSIYLRWAENADVRSVFTEIKAVDYPLLDQLPEFKDILAEIFHAVMGEELGRAMLVNLKSGGHINTHIDEGDYADYYDRFHLCLDSGPRVNFMIDHTSLRHYECVNMQPGELWWFDHKKPHCVDNVSNRDRIHLIVDIKTARYRDGGS